MLAEADIAPNTPFRLTVDDFELLAAAGAFRNNERVELIEGEISTMAPLHMPHAAVQAELIIRLGLALREAAPALRVATTPSLALPPHSMPMPDILVVPQSRIGEGPAQPDDATLLIEVSHTTSRLDLGVKARLYANASIPEYWVFDMKAGQVQVLWQPEQGRFTQQRICALGENVIAQTIPGLIVDTADLV